MIPIMFLKIFPPKYSEISIISKPAKFFINFTMKKEMMMANKLTKIKLSMVADLVETKISLGLDKMVCVTIMVRINMIASMVPIFDFVIFYSFLRQWGTGSFCLTIFGVFCRFFFFRHLSTLFVNKKDLSLFVLFVLLFSFYSFLFYCLWYFHFMEIFSCSFSLLEAI